MTRKPDLRPFKGWPDSQSHSAMRSWAKENAQPNLTMTTTFEDGSELLEVYEPATKEVSYKVDGEVYTQAVDIENKWLWDKVEPMTKNQLVRTQKSFCEKGGYKFTITAQIG